MRLVKYRGKFAVYLENGKRHSLRTADRAVAERNFEEYKRQANGKKETIGEIVQAYLEAKKDKSSIKGMEDAWSAAKSRFSNLRPAQCTRGVCQDYAEARRNDAISNGTIRKELGVIRQALRWHNPQAEIQIDLPPAPPPRERHLSKTEFKALLEACTTPHLKLFVQIAIGTGARRGAILDLTWKQVDLERGIITLSKGSETNKRRAVVKMNEQLKTTLQAAKNDALGEYVIEYGGKPVIAINKAFRKACEKAGLKGVSPHTLRHTAAVRMAEAGIQMSEIAQMLGHTNVNTTFRVYARYSPEYLSKAADALIY
jgi:integrase